jgi:hypothetical protein
VSQITVTRDNDMKLIGFTEKDQRAYSKLKTRLAELEPGELCGFSVWFPRNPRLHRLHFGVMKAVLEAQEQFDDINPLRKWLYVGAGHADFLPGPHGRMVAIPKSIAYDKVDDAEFSALHEKVIDFLRTEHAPRFLWGHLSEEQTYETVETILGQFEREPA